MNYYNSHILVGSRDWYGRFGYETIISRQENSSPVWVVETMVDGRVESRTFENLRVIPSLERLIEDALIILAYSIEKKQAVIDYVDRLMGNRDSAFLAMYEDLTEKQRDELHALLKMQDFESELVFVDIPLSSVESLKSYKLKARYLANIA